MKEMHRLILASVGWTMFTVLAFFIVIVLVVNYTRHVVLDNSFSSQQDRIQDWSCLEWKNDDVSQSNSFYLSHYPANCDYIINHTEDLFQCINFDKVCIREGLDCRNESIHDCELNSCLYNSNINSPFFSLNDCIKGCETLFMKYLDCTNLGCYANPIVYDASYTVCEQEREVK